MADAESVSSVSPSLPEATPAHPRGELTRTVLRVAWMSIALGLALEILLLVLRAYSDTAGGTPKPFLADLAQKVSWSFIVCVGLAFGTAAGKARAGVIGLLGLISAPLGFTVARSVHKAVSQGLAVAGPAVAGASPFLIGGLKGLQYAALGALLGWVSRRAGSGLGSYLAAGTGVGLTFGAAVLAVMANASPDPLPAVDLAARGINEVIFPIGCSLVLYAAEGIGKRLG